MYDYHIHSNLGEGNSPEEFLAAAKAGGVEGGCIISPMPAGYFRVDGWDQRWENLLDYVLEYTSRTPNFKPTFWIDPTDGDIARQIDVAVDKGIAEFKIICNHFFPKDVLKPISQIAEAGRPINFHCGILFSTTPAAKYNRPIEFECLMQIKNLRFSLAHIGWPWTDEYTSIIGEFFWGNGPECNNVDVYADLTPGTPAVYRKEALRKLYLSGYPKLKSHVLWGTDKYTNNYSPDSPRILAQMDKAIIQDIITEAPSILPYGKDYQDCWNLLEKQNFQSFFS